MERWFEINHYPRYEVSSNGRIRNIKTGRVLSPGINTEGYYVVVLTNLQGQKTKRVHRLVAEAFFDIVDNSACVVNHIDGDKRNNFIGNLEFCTSGENNRHAYQIGLKQPVRNQVHLNKRKIQIVETGEVFDGINECARITGCNRRHIQDCLSGRLNSHRGLHFKEVKENVL